MARVSGHEAWRAHGSLATLARVCAVVLPIAAAVAGALAVRELFDDVSLGARLAWAPVVVLAAAPPVLLLERMSAFLFALADLVGRRVDFAERPPSRIDLAWRVSSPRESEMVVERMRRHGLPSRRHVVPLLASILGLERHHPEMRARLVPARRCADLLADGLELPDEERQLSQWLVALRLTADIIDPPDLNAWLAAAVRTLPGAPSAPARSALIGALSGFAMEFGLLTAAPPHGVGLPGPLARSMLVDAARDHADPEVLEAFRRIPDEDLAGLAPAPAEPARRPPWVRRVPLAPALALGTAVLVGVVAVSGVGRDDETPAVLGNTEGNAAPEARADTVEVHAGASVVVDVVANDGDRDDDVLVVDRFEQARLGTVERFGGRLRYTAGGAAGTDRFRYVVSDGHGGTDEGVVTVTVVP